MKRIVVLLCFVLLLLFSGCGGAPSSSESSPAGGESSAPYALKYTPEDRNPGEFRTYGFAETQEGCYYGFNMLLYFCPRGENKSFPLCGKPNCRHEDNTCNAWYGGGDFIFFNGSIYMSDRLDVIKMNPDGSDHQIVAHVDLSAVSYSGYSTFFHHGRFFVITLHDESLPSELQTEHIYALSLSDNTQTELAVDYFQNVRFASYAPICCKNKLYFEVYAKEESVSDEADAALIELDIETGAIRTLYTDCCCNGFNVTDSACFAYTNPGFWTQYGIETSHKGFWEYDLNSGEFREYDSPVGELQYVRYDGDFVYGESVDGKTLYFLSTEYQTLDQLELPDGLVLAAAAGDRLYFSAGVDIMRSPFTYYLDKAGIGSHNLKLKQLD